MSQPTPQISYNEQGIFTVSEPSFTDNKDHVLEALEALPGVVLTYGGRVNVVVEVDKLLGKSADDELNLETALRLIGLMLPVHPRDGIDRVAGLEWLSARGANGSVYPRLQRWLNDGPIEEDIAREVLTAMARPFGKSQVRRTNNSFQYGSGTATDGLFTVGARVRRFDHRLNGVSESVQWRTLNFATLGLCACWGVEEWVVRKALLPKLYEFKPHNIDSPKSALSLVLGLGVLAKHAAESSPHGKAFADAKP